MENLTGGTPPVRYLPCVVPCKLYFYPVKVNVDGVVYELNYYVDIDAISGNILEIAHDVY